MTEMEPGGTTAPASDAPHGAEFCTVGIGASAGGVEALEALFLAMPAAPGMAFVVVTHLGSGRVSLLSEIIGRRTAMPVREARDGDRPERDHVYVLPPDAVLTIADGRLRLRTTGAADHERNPIDLFFASLAADQGDRAIAIVLSGGGSDGTIGARAVKEHGGLVLAQGADSVPPRYPSMPASAVASGLVDLVLPVEQMPTRLVEYCRTFDAVRSLTTDNPPEDAGERLATARAEICRILRAQVGHDFRGYKSKTFLRRVQRRMQLVQLSTVEGYIERLQHDGDEVRELFRDLLIGVTSFFRDPEAFDALRQVIPELFDGRGADGAVRVWVPGCSTGEEAYSIAMLLREHMDTLAVAPKVQVFATDIDEDSLRAARAGRYPAGYVEPIAEARLRRFFTRDGDHYTLVRDVRDLCVFSSHSLIRDPPFSRIDLLSCRNLLIYLDGDLQNRVIPIFHYALRPGGYLFLGNSENVSQYGDLFAPVDRKHRLFRSRAHGGTRLPLPMFGNDIRAGLPQGAASAGVQSRRAASAMRQNVEARVLDQYAPAHVLVDRDGDVIWYSARTGKYFEAAPGSPTRQIVALARKGLRLDLHAALREVVEQRRAVTREGIAITVDDRVQFLNVVVEPFGDGDGEPLYLVVFNDVGRPLSPEEAADASPLARAGRPEADKIERDLRETRERLQSTIEEYETALEELKSANEELVSMNEELQSTNEEMETSKEELQSINEEMQTVHLELNYKLEELSRSKTDMENLFASTQIATVFLDAALRIRSFTPAVGAIFNLIPGDCGRPLTDITGNVAYPQMQEDLQAVLDRHETAERRVAYPDGTRHYLTRVLPYWAEDRRFDGVVVTFVDVTTIIRAEQQLRTLIDELNHRVRNMLAIVVTLATHTLAGAPGLEDQVNAFVERLLSMARTYSVLSEASWSQVGLGQVVASELEPYALADRARIRTGGPEVQLNPKAALAIGLVVHELATNAAKYGALSTPSGYVEVTWAAARAEGDVPAVAIDWKESGGPPVVPPAHNGFGTRLIEQQVRYGVRGTLVVDYPPAGVRARIVMPLDDVTTA